MSERLINNLYGKGTIGFTCDSCGRETNGCNIVNGMKFCAKCYQETFGKDNQQNEIQQLKQQLEEKDKQIDILKRLNNQVCENFDQARKKHRKNQTQLAIQELEEIINIFEPYENDNRDTILELNNNVSFIDYIEQRLKELKGE